MARGTPACGATRKEKEKISQGGVSGASGVFQGCFRGVRGCQEAYETGWPSPNVGDKLEDEHEDEVEVGQAPELLKEVLEDKVPNRVLGRADPVARRRTRLH